MPSEVEGKLTLYNLFNPSAGKCDNRNLKAIRASLESVTIDDISSSGLSSIFMVDGENGTAHSSEVSTQSTSSKKDRIIWTIIINKMKNVELEKLIPDFKSWFEEDILRFARGEKREEGEIRATLAGHTL